MLARWASKQEKREGEKKHVVKMVFKTVQKPVQNSSKREVESNLERSVQKVEKNFRKRAPKRFPKRLETRSENEAFGGGDREGNQNPDYKEMWWCSRRSGGLLSILTACQKTDIGHRTSYIRKLTAKTSDIR